MNKSTMIKEAVNALGIGATNQEIKAYILKKHKRLVSSSQIVNTIGAHKKRIASTKISVDMERAAVRYLSLVGDFSMAKSLLALAEARRCN